jgi:hypothetical protein
MNWKKINARKWCWRNIRYLVFRNFPGEMDEKQRHRSSDSPFLNPDVKSGLRALNYVWTFNQEISVLPLPNCKPVCVKLSCRKPTEYDSRSSHLIFISYPPVAETAVKSGRHSVAITWEPIELFNVVGYSPSPGRGLQRRDCLLNTPSHLSIGQKIKLSL